MERNEFELSSALDNIQRQKNELYAKEQEANNNTMVILPLRF